MITVSFVFRDGQISGFEVEGHSGYADEGMDIVCAAVSSAVELAGRIITDELKTGTAKIDPARAYVSLILENSGKNEQALAVLSALKAHLTEIAGQYPKFVRISNL